MAELEKVIKGLEHCAFGVSDTCYENDCPYYQSNDCTVELKDDILALLKEYEERIKVLQRTIERMPKPVKLLDVLGNNYEKIVRCKYCEHATMTADGKLCKYCELDKDDFGYPREVYHDADWFCPEGKRKEGQ